jgi:hypothetical protein
VLLLLHAPIYISSEKITTKSQTSSLTRPVSSPLATALNNADKLPGNNAVRLLARVQFVVPHKTVRARVVGAVRVVGVAGDIERRRTVEVLRGVVVDVGEL